MPDRVTKNINMRLLEMSTSLSNPKIKKRDKILSVLELK